MIKEKLDIKNADVYLMDDGSYEVHDGIQVLKFDKDLNLISYGFDFSIYKEMLEFESKTYNKMVEEVINFENETMDMLKNAKTEEELKEVNKRIDVLKKG